MKKWIALLTLLTTFTLSCSDYGSDISVSENQTLVNPDDSISNPLPDNLLNPNEGEFSEVRMLVNIGLNVIYKNVRDFKLQTEILESRIDAYCEDLDEDILQNLSSEKEAKNQWETTMLSYHRVEAAPVGPLTDDKLFADEIYSWPLISPCAIDQEVAKFAETRQINNELLVNTRGLGALEYLFFEPSLVPKCSPAFFAKAIAWGQKPMAQKKKDRCQFSKYLVADLVKKATRLENLWSPQKRNFTKTLIDGSRFTSTKQAINAVTDSLFSLEKLKEDKLSKPLGLSAECKNDSKKCPEMAEHPWSGIALKAISAQLDGFKGVFWGSTSTIKKAYGFDDYLIKAQHPQVVESMKTHLSRAISGANTLGQAQSLQAQIEAMDPEKCATSTLANPLEPLCVFYQDVRSANILLKEDLLIIFALQAPATFQGDND